MKIRLTLEVADKGKIKKYKTNLREIDEAVLGFSCRVLLHTLLECLEAKKIAPLGRID